MDTEILNNLISFNTSGDNSNFGLIEYVQNCLKPLGFIIKIIKVGDQSNLFAYKNCLSPRIILAAHTDTVAVGDGWKSDLLLAKIDRNKIFGLGSCDTKSFISMMLEVARRYQKKKNLALLLTFGEENDFGGAKLIGKSIIRPKDMVIVGEPTDCQVVTSAKGVAAYSVEFTGKEAHGSEPSKGVSAIKSTAEFIESLKGTSMFINFGKIKGGTASNVVPKNCTLGMEIRYSNSNEIVDIENRMKAVALESSSRVRIKKLFDIPAFDAGDEVNSIICYRNVDQGSKVSFCSEANLYSKLTKNCIILGPGNIKDAHKSNEFVRISRIKKCQRILNKLIRSL